MQSYDHEKTNAEPAHNEPQPDRTTPDSMPDSTLVPLWAARLQRKPVLKVSTPSDPLEQEADRVADQVMRSPGTPVYYHPEASPAPAAPLQRKSAYAPAPRDVTPAAHAVLRAPGQALETGTRAFMEARFGRDFGDVRVHTGPVAERAAGSVNARAYTVGHHVVFGPGQYAPGTREGRHLLAHELAHVSQQTADGSTRQPDPAHAVIYRVPQPPDISHNGYYTFYLTNLAQGGRTRGFAAQFTMIDDATNTASVKLSYQLTRHMREFQFQLPQSQTLRPRLLSQDVTTATFDLDGNGSSDLEILLLANSSSQGFRVYITRPGETLGTYIIPPPQRQIVPNRGYPMGTLPNGKRYYLQPWTYHLPGGPRYVDEDGMGVNPGLEFQAAATLDTWMRMYLFSIGAVAAVTIGTVMVSELAASAVVVSSVARGAGAIRWLFSGTRLIAGGTSAGANLATQAMDYGADWDQYNWESVGFDYVIGAISYSFAKSVITRWPAPLFSRQIGQLSTWTNLGKQQVILALYGTLVGAIRAQVSNTGTGATVGAQHTEGALQTIKSVGLQSFLASPTGRRLFPAGFNDPRIVFASRLLTFVTKLAVREVFNVTPQSSQGQQQGQSTAGQGAE